MEGMDDTGRTARVRSSRPFSSKPYHDESLLAEARHPRRGPRGGGHLKIGARVVILANSQVSVKAPNHEGRVAIVTEVPGQCSCFGSSTKVPELTNVPCYLMFLPSLSPSSPPFLLSAPSHVVQG